MTEKYKIQIVAPGRTGSTFLHQVLSDELVGDSAYRFNEPIGVPYDDLLLGGELFDEKALSDVQHVIENSKFLKNGSYYHQVCATYVLLIRSSIAQASYTQQFCQLFSCFHPLQLR